MEDYFTAHHHITYFFCHTSLSACCRCVRHHVVKTRTVIRINTLMPPPPTHNLHNRADNEDINQQQFLERCRAYVDDPRSVPLPDGLLPSSLIRPLLDNEPLQQQKWILGGVVYYRVLELEPEYSGHITGILLESSNDQILQM